MKYKCWYLQLFAEGISGEGNAAAAGQQTAGSDPERAENTQVAAAKPTRLTWAQILADPEYNREMQKTVSARLKAAQSNWQKKAFSGKKLPPEGADEGKPIAQTQNQIGGAHSKDPHPTTFPQGEAMESRIRQHYDGLLAQAEKLRQVFPEFSLEDALQDPEFIRLTAPHVGVSVESAYYLRNRQKHQAAAMQLAAQKTAEKLSNAIRSGQFRPVENGTSGQAPAVTAFDYAHATAQQRLALKNAIRRSASRGEKIYPENQTFTKV